MITSPAEKIDVKAKSVEITEFIGKGEGIGFV